MESRLRDAINSVEVGIFQVDEECSITTVDARVKDSALDILYDCLSALHALQLDEYGGDEEWVGPVEMRIMQELDMEEGIGDYFGPDGRLRIPV